MRHFDEALTERDCGSGCNPSGVSQIFGYDVIRRADRTYQLFPQRIRATPRLVRRSAGLLEMARQLTPDLCRVGIAAGATLLVLAVFRLSPKARALPR